MLSQAGNMLKYMLNKLVESFSLCMLTSFMLIKKASVVDNNNMNEGLI